jgi:phosphoribosylglycinamide formyltransferase-1
VSARLVVLASGSGTLLQSLIDAVASGQLDASIVAVGSDVPDATALERAQRAGIPTFVEQPSDFADRAGWNAALTARVRAAEPDWVVSAGFMRILGPDFVDSFPGRIINTHPALLPSFAGAHGVRDALAHGVKVTGCTVHLVDHGVDTGPILAQRAVDVLPDDDEASLHERIKEIERPLLVDTLAALIGGTRE